jgi:hypothetical protein
MILEEDTTLPMEVVKWYTTPFIKFEIIKAMRSREMAFIETSGNVVVRDLAGWNTDYFEYSLEAYNFWRRDFRIYRSVGQLEKIPLVNFNNREREEDKELVREAWKGCVNYDFVIDLDAVDFKDAKRDADEICGLYRDLEIPYMIQYSGNKGFHITVADRHTPPMLDKKEAAKDWVNLVDYMCKLRTFDSTIYETRRILKAPYTIDFKSGEPRVVLPLSDRQLSTFKVQDAKISNVLDQCAVKNRGMLEREGSSKAAVKFLKEAQSG